MVDRLNFALPYLVLTVLSTTGGAVLGGLYGFLGALPDGFAAWIGYLGVVTGCAAGAGAFLTGAAAHALSPRLGLPLGRRVLTSVSAAVGAAAVTATAMVIGHVIPGYAVAHVSAAFLLSGLIAAASYPTVTRHCTRVITAA